MDLITLMTFNQVYQKFELNKHKKITEKCDPTWTKFYNRDRPSGTGDWETLTSLRAENPGQICANPIAVEARLADGRLASM